MSTDRYGVTRGQECRAQKKNRKESKIQEFMYGDTTNVEYEIRDFVGNNWSHQNGNVVLN